MFVGVGALRVRDTFEQAAKKSPSVIFIDELDAVGRRRGSTVHWANEEREQTLNQLLACMDGFNQRHAVVVLAATNRIDVLDSALTRPGRFDRRIEIRPPSHSDRKEILAVHTRTKSLAPDVSLEELAELSNELNGAEIETWANEATVTALRRTSGKSERLHVSREDFLSSLGPLRERSKLFTKLDLVLIESAASLAQPSGSANVKCVLRGGEEVSGAVIWANAAYVKLNTAEGAVRFSKREITSLEPC